MPFYMTQASFTPEASKAMIANPPDRASAIGKMLEAAGARLHHYFFAFGEYDVVLIAEGPDNTTVASVLMAVAGSGALAKMKTTVLMTHDEGAEAYRRAGTIAYTPPGS